MEEVKKVTLLEWLDQEHDVVKEGKKAKTSILRYFCELIGINGGSLNVRSWGKIQEGVGPYGRIGLRIDEAMALINLGGIFTGFVLAQGEVMAAAAHVKMQNEINRVKKEGFDQGGPVISIYTEDDLKSLDKVVAKVKKQGVAKLELQL